MASQREDYLMRLLAQLRELVASLGRLRAAGRHAEALQLLLQAQERLFGRTVAELAPLSLEAQLDLLVTDVPAPVAAEKCALYAALLREVAATYRERGAAALAPAALALAAQVVLAAAGRLRGVAPEPLAAAARELLPAV